MAQANHAPTASRALITGARPTPSTIPISVAYAKLVSGLVPDRAFPFHLIPGALDLERRLFRVKCLLVAPRYLRIILDDTAENVPGGFDLHQIDALLADVPSEVIGILAYAAETLPEMVP